MYNTTFGESLPRHCFTRKPKVAIYSDFVSIHDTHSEHLGGVFCLLRMCIYRYIMYICIDIYNVYLYIEIYNVYL